MSEIFGFLAMECGWDFKFIARTFTMTQIIRYYQSISDLKFHHMGMAIQGNMVATATGHGNLKMNAFNDFVSQFFKQKKSKIDANKTVDDMKSQGLPIEDN